MIAELKNVICKVEQLKDEDQRHIAKILEEDIKWDSTLQNSYSKLNKLAQEALKEYESGKTEQADW